MDDGEKQQGGHHRVLDEISIDSYHSEDDEERTRKMGFGDMMVALVVSITTKREWSGNVQFCLVTRVNASQPILSHGESSHQDDNIHRTGSSLVSHYSFVITQPLI